MPRFYTFSTYCKKRFDTPVRKILLDAGSTCPNRDGSLSSLGCAFCDEKGAGTGLFSRGSSLQEQWTQARAFMQAGSCTRTRFLAYLQSYSNTYGPLEKLARLLEQIQTLPDLAGLCLATRPDCLDKDKYSLLAQAPFDELWLDLGLQSACDATLRRINRGHTASDFARSVCQAAQHNIKVCAHVIAGLPGETIQDFLSSIRFLSTLPVAGVKLHNLYLIRGTALAKHFEKQPFALLSRQEYLDAVVQALTLLPADIVIHRVVSDFCQLSPASLAHPSAPLPPSAQKQLLAPDWILHKQTFLHELHGTLQKENLWQGCYATTQPRSAATPFVPDFLPAEGALPGLPSCLCSQPGLSGKSGPCGPSGKSGPCGPSGDAPLNNSPQQRANAQEQH